MADTKYPYTTAPGTLRKIMAQAPRVGRPDKINREWLDQAGYTSSNDRTVPSVLKFVGIVGTDNAPTPIWDALRGGSKADKAKIADAIRKAYSDLFAMYPDAHRKDDEALRNFFRAKTVVGEDAQTRMIQTFKVLIEFGDFEAEAPESADGPERERPGSNQRDQGGRGKVEFGAGTPPLTLNVNIQLQLPATGEADVYDKLFAAMRKHLIDLSQPS